MPLKRELGLRDLTLFAIACSVVPTGEIHNVWLFEGKLAGGTFAVVASGWVIYRRYQKDTS